MDTKIDPILYKRIDVWRRINDETAIKYICFQLLEAGKYCVQNADCFYYPITKEQLASSEMQSVELFIESFPDERNIAYESLREAIEAHDREFADFAESKSEEQQ